MAKTKEATRPISGEEKVTDTSKRSKKTTTKNKKSKEKQPEKKRYKILAGNGCHQAIAEVQGMLIPPPKSFSAELKNAPRG